MRQSIQNREEISFPQNLAYTHTEPNQLKQALISSCGTDKASPIGFFHITGLKQPIIVAIGTASVSVLYRPLLTNILAGSKSWRVARRHGAFIPAAREVSTRGGTELTCRTEECHPRYDDNVMNTSNTVVFFTLKRLIQLSLSSRY